MLILEKLGQVPNDSDSWKAPQICLGFVVICGYPCLRWLNPVPGGTYKCHSIHCNLPNSDTSSIRTLSMTQVKGLSKAASGTLDPREGYTQWGYKDVHQHYTALWAKKGEGGQWQWLLHGRIYDSLLGWVCLSSAADRGSALGQWRCPIHLLSWEGFEEHLGTLGTTPILVLFSNSKHKFPSVVASPSCFCHTKVRGPFSPTFKTSFCGGKA